ncbi:hypothetical protein [Dyadobacter sp. CY312]|uniref:hypothetical protein n=1 Tax=Dyadobacter sp. CY312 TaxID=2907303 RepID=UPI001F362545|nr:hypothetical protein [Dyadobacter sp. CY312]MCE7040339.1 hypothetical protein [Dyadobacter sp. CY312]
MKTIQSLLLLSFFAMLQACSGNSEKSELLAEANQLHLESVEIHENLEKKLNLMLAKEKDLSRLKTLDSLHNLIELWETGLVEVPGFEHAHSHGAHHEHKAAPAMTEESMLEYQKNGKEAIQELEGALKNLSQAQ